MFEFLRWRASFKEYARGVKRGDLLFKRPRPYFDLTSKMEWAKFLVLIFGGTWVAGIIGIIAYLVIPGLLGYYDPNIYPWIYAFMGAWLLYWILQLVHSIRFYKISKLANVEFVSLDKARGIGKRILTMPQNLTAADYNILYSRYIWADVEHQPYRDVTDWVERISAVQSGASAPAPTVEGETVPGAMGDALGKAIGSFIGEKYSESKLKEIIDTAGGIPSPSEIIKILQTEWIPEYRDLLGERLAMLYLFNERLTLK